MQLLWRSAAGIHGLSALLSAGQYRRAVSPGEQRRKVSERRKLLDRSPLCFHLVKEFTSGAVNELSSCEGFTSGAVNEPIPLQQPRAGAGADLRSQ